MSGREALGGLATTASACPLVANRGSHLLGLSLSGGKVHHPDPLLLEHWLMPRRRVQLDHGSGLLASELALPCCCPLLGGQLPRKGLLLKGKLAIGHSATVHGGAVIVTGAARAFSIYGVVVMGAGEVLMLHLLGEGRPKPSSPLDAIRNSLAESYIMAHHGDEAPL
jgi:hypothetical protein